MPNMTELLKQLLVPNISEKNLKELLSFSKELTYEAGTIIYREDEESSQLLIVEDGQVDVQYMMATGRRETLDTCHHGDILVWSAVVAPYSTNSIGVARSKTNLVAIDGPKLRALCEKDMEFGYHLMSHVAVVIRRRLQAARREIVSLRD